VSGRHRIATNAAAKRAVALVVAVAALFATGVLALGADQPGVAAEPRPEAAAALAPATPAPTWKVVPANPETATARPTRVRIPAIGVDSRVVTIGVDRTGALIPPPTTDVTGWFAAGPVPGAIGPALLAAHVDSRAGPGAFFRLAELRPGDVVIVDRADHTSARFVVDSTARIAKNAFPTELIYSPKPVAMLRLVTCGGSFDAQKRSYLDNVIVNATIR
jgi:sortase (surface protein transpeptidase)